MFEFLWFSYMIVIPVLVFAHNHEVWDLKNFKSLVTFGDSYTDESRIGYFSSHKGSAPPVGWIGPPVSKELLLFHAQITRG